MTIRLATLGDTVRILAVAEMARRESRYAETCEINRDYARKFFHKAIHTNGHTNHGGTLFLVCEKRGVVEGYLLASLDRVYQIGEKLVAVEIHTYVTARADPRDASRMIDEYVAWAEGNDDVLEIVMSQSDLMGQEDARYGALLDRKGFVKCGTAYRRPRVPGSAVVARTVESREEIACHS